MKIISVEDIQREAQKIKESLAGRTSPAIDPNYHRAVNILANVILLRQEASCLKCDRLIFADQIDRREKEDTPWPDH